MITDIKNYIVFPSVKKVKKGTFFELAKKYIIKGKKSIATLSQDVDLLLY